MGWNRHTGIPAEQTCRVNWKFRPIKCELDALHFIYFQREYAQRAFKMPIFFSGLIFSKTRGASDAKSCVTGKILGRSVIRYCAVFYLCITQIDLFVFEKIRSEKKNAPRSVLTALHRLTKSLTCVLCVNMK